jgi:hypothetical protein
VEYGSSEALLLTVFDWFQLLVKFDESIGVCEVKNLQNQSNDFAQNLIIALALTFPLELEKSVLKVKRQYSYYFICFIQYKNNKDEEFIVGKCQYHHYWLCWVPQSEFTLSPLKQ